LRLKNIVTDVKKIIQSFCRIGKKRENDYGWLYYGFNLLLILREVAISIDDHRYGKLSVREGELRKPVL